MKKRGAFWTRFRDAVSKLFGSSCLLFSSLSVSKVFWWLWNTNFHMIRRPIGESFHYELFRKLERCSELFQNSFSRRKFIFHEKVSETAVNPAPLVVSLEECNFISKFSEKRRKLIKCFVMQGNHRQKNFLHTQLLWFRSFSSLVHALHSTTKFKCMQIWSSIKKFSPLFW